MYMLTICSMEAAATVLVMSVADMWTSSLYKELKARSRAAGKGRETVCRVA